MSVAPKPLPPGHFYLKSQNPFDQRSRSFRMAVAGPVVNDPSPDTLNDVTFRSASSSTSSVGPRLTYAPKQSTAVPGVDEIETEEVTEKEKKELLARIQSGPSSRNTVMALAGLFIVGLTLIISGILVFMTETSTEFYIAGGVFLGLGAIFMFICALIQRKNMLKYAHELEQDLYFLNITENPIWKLMVGVVEAIPQAPKK